MDVAATAPLPRVQVRAVVRRCHRLAVLGSLKSVRAPRLGEGARPVHAEPAQRVGSAPLGLVEARCALTAVLHLRQRHLLAGRPLTRLAHLCRRAPGRSGGSSLRGGGSGGVVAVNGARAAHAERIDFAVLEAVARRGRCGHAGRTAEGALGEEVGLLLPLVLLHALLVLGGEVVHWALGRAGPGDERAWSVTQPAAARGAAFPVEVGRSSGGNAERRALLLARLPRGRAGS
mmetsp:Transcript_8585/g.25326  ORF Transcript_8585/g.25326 Transcript_8585/m.25326 type:complete len:232 (+) Transcript_8585:1392-2087(+)